MPMRNSCHVILVTHASAERDAPRPLSDRGIADASDVGRRVGGLVTAGVAPPIQRVASAPAVRCIQTLLEVMRGARDALQLDPAELAIERALRERPGEHLTPGLLAEAIDASAARGVCVLIVTHGDLPSALEPGQRARLRHDLLDVSGSGAWFKPRPVLVVLHVPDVLAHLLNAEARTSARLVRAEYQEGERYESLLAG
jgi:phosphohistidine phosphatase SixA